MKSTSGLNTIAAQAQRFALGNLGMIRTDRSGIFLGAALANTQPRPFGISTHLEDVMKSTSGLNTIAAQFAQAHFADFTSELWKQARQEAHKAADADTVDRDYIFYVALIMYVVALGFVFDMFFSDFEDPNRFEFFAATLTANGAGAMAYSATRKFPTWVDRQLKGVQ
ncbi:hypothetical protein [Nocardiopsis sp. CNR-923]|uniref:hypothetical protein n=1 Tax=Nocardiopsis sp. CNR-923 TaxID=1904965 RepID=UPI00117D2E2E|nr:hypothetical protein [Nocardiopsis sp. CNR-923]